MGDLAAKEKASVALTSLVAAVVLTSLKLVVGIATGSLGILSEAAHSALDLVAAGMTYWAVRFSSRPADREHTYGHGKFENLSALFETVLLFATCIWIFYESIDRLFFHPVKVDASFWGFIVMAVSIAIDYSRSRALGRVAKKYDSQALEADALHFSTDIWSSTVVIIGLGCVFAAEHFGLAWLHLADTFAAMGVACIVVWVSIRLGKRTIDVLLDAVPPGTQEKVTAAAAVPGVIEVRQVRIRKSGAAAFVDILLSVGREIAFEHAHTIATAAERAVCAVLPGADIVVHVEPVAAGNEDLLTTVRLIATRYSLVAHNACVYDIDGARCVELHVEVPEGLQLREAHDRVSMFESDLRLAAPDVAQVLTHIEPARDGSSVIGSSAADVAPVRAVLAALEDELGTRFQPHRILVQRVAGELCVSFHCMLDGAMTVAAAHAFTDEIEHRLRARVRGVSRVVIHAEPGTPTG